MIDIDVTNDPLVEATETVTMTLTGVTGDPTSRWTTGRRRRPGTLPTTTARKVSVAKSAGGDGSETGPDDGQFTVTLSAASSTATTVTYTLGGEATEGSDYATIATKSVTIAAGDTTAVIDIDVTDDPLVEATETVTVTLTGVTGDTDITLDDGAKTASLNITDNDSAKVSVAKSAGGDGSETGPDDGQFTVTLSAASSTATTVTYTLGGDGDGRQRLRDDRHQERHDRGRRHNGGDRHRRDERPAGRGHGNGVGDADGRDRRRRHHAGRRGQDASLDITDNDSAKVSVAKSAGGDGSETGPDDGQFTVTLSAASSTATTVTYTLGGDATEGSDYATIATKSVTIAAGDTTAVIDIDVTDDPLVEATEAVSVTLTGVTGDADITLDDGAKTASLNITDNDSAKVSVAKSADGDGSETGPDDGQFTVTLSAASSTATTVTYTLGGDATEGSDYATIATKSVTIAAGIQRR